MMSYAKLSAVGLTGLLVVSLGVVMTLQPPTYAPLPAPGSYTDNTYYGTTAYGSYVPVPPPASCGEWAHFESEAQLRERINNTYGYYSGTSMASPMAAGAAALLLSRCPMNTAALKSLLMASVDPLPAFASITVTGGRLNVAKALQTCAAGRPGMPPSVSLTAPLDKSTYFQPLTLRLDASAADTDGSVVNVAFYAGSTLIGSSSAAP